MLSHSEGLQEPSSPKCLQLENREVTLMQRHAPVKFMLPVRVRSGAGQAEKSCEALLAMEEQEAASRAWALRAL